MPHLELDTLIGLIARLVLDVRTGGLMLLLVIAAVYDYRTHRIPNWLVVYGSVFGVIYTTAAPPIVHGTVLFPVSGLLVGLFVFLPLYLLRAMGAGDVKLLAMVGTFLGPLATLYAALATIVAGGILSIVWVLAHGRLLRMLKNIGAVLEHAFVGALAGAPTGLRVSPEASAGKLPYGIAIGSGTVTYLFMHQLGLL